MPDTESRPPQSAVPVFQVDAFTDRPFFGNPAAVCLLASPRDDSWMLAVAAEMNVSETAFLLPLAQGFSLRWFTPTTEVELCGHATLAAAHVLWHTGILPSEVDAQFSTRSGVLTATREGDDIVLTFPSLLPTPTALPDGLLAALGTEAVTDTAQTGEKLLLQLKDEAAVRALAPDFAALRQLPLRGVIVTAAADAATPFDFVSRYFAPWVGIDEDPVTGSAHCGLGPYWQQRTGKDDLLACQASARGGALRVRVHADRVELIGRAVTVLQGSLHC